MYLSNKEMLPVFPDTWVLLTSSQKPTRTTPPSSEIPRHSSDLERQLKGWAGPGELDSGPSSASIHWGTWANCLPS